MSKPQIIVISGPNEDAFRWLSNGWYTIQQTGTQEAEKLMAIANQAIEAGTDVPDTIKRLKEAGFEIIITGSPNSLSTPFEAFFKQGLGKFVPVSHRYRGSHFWIMLTKTRTISETETVVSYYENSQCVMSYVVREGQLTEGHFKIGGETTVLNGPLLHECEKLGAQPPMDATPFSYERK